MPNMKFLEYIADTLYTRVKNTFGETSAQYREIQSLNQDKLAKIIKALELLQIQIDGITFNHGEYTITASDDAISKLGNIYYTTQIPPPQQSQSSISQQPPQYAPPPPRQTTEQLQPPPTATSISMQQVAAFTRFERQLPGEQYARTVQLNCPPRILQAFQQLMTGTQVLGSTFLNPYTNMEERFPLNPSELTARHLQILARNEEFNTTGIINFSLYNNLLTPSQIAQLRCLVKATNVTGFTQAVNYGGYGNGSDVTPHQQDIIVIDQAGLQWQGDFSNTGGMFFYPPQGRQFDPNYIQLQNAMYQTMYGIERPTTPSTNVIEVNWRTSRGIINGLIDLNQVAMAIQHEFLQALDAAANQSQYLVDDLNIKINFRFLKAGMGFFADGIASAKPALEIARLQGIKIALQSILALPAEQRRTILNRIGRLELPFSDGNSPAINQLIDDIAGLTRNLGLFWGGAGVIDAFAPVTRNPEQPQIQYITAVTNCGDPHAMIGNEGGYSSVDAAMATNAPLHHLNACFNSRMQLRATPALASEVQPSIPATWGTQQQPQQYVAPPTWGSTAASPTWGTQQQLPATPTRGRTTVQQQIPQQQPLSTSSSQSSTSAWITASPAPLTAAGVPMGLTPQYVAPPLRTQQQSQPTQPTAMPQQQIPQQQPHSTSSLQSSTSAWITASPAPLTFSSPPKHLAMPEIIGNPRNEYMIKLLCNLANTFNDELKQKGQWAYLTSTLEIGRTTQDGFLTYANQKFQIIFDSPQTIKILDKHNSYKEILPSDPQYQEALNTIFTNIPSPLIINTFLITKMKELINLSTAQKNWHNIGADWIIGRSKTSQQPVFANSHYHIVLENNNLIVLDKTNKFKPVDANTKDRVLSDLANVFPELQEINQATQEFMRRTAPPKPSRP